MSLVLVLAMVFGLASTAFAVDTGYADNDEIQNTEAVAVMSGMGIINGKDNNEFKPADTFRRCEAAKIMTYMMLGPDTAEALKATADPYPDTPKDAWYAGSVAYVTSKGLVCGWDGEFHPEDTLARAQWLKMLLGVLGYDTSDLVGNNYEVATEAAAVEAGIVTAEELKLDFNRDTAVLYAWNAMWAPLAGKTAQYIVTVNGVAHTFDTLLEAVAKAIDAHKDNNGSAKVTLEMVDTLGEKVFDLAFVFTSDAYGRPETSYTYKTGNELTVIDHTPLLTYNVEVTGEKIVRDLKDFAYVDLAQYWVDGVPQNNIWDIAEDKNEQWGAQGTVLEIYENPLAWTGAGDYIVVEINTYVHEVELSEVGKNAGPEIALDEYRASVKTADYDAGDVIAYTVGCNTGYSKVGPNPPQVDARVILGTERTVTAQNTTAGYVKIDNGAATKVNVNAEVAVNDDSSTAAQILAGLAKGTKKTFYYDAYGNILYVAPPAPVIYGVTFVLDTEDLYDAPDSLVIDPEGETWAAGMRALSLDGEVYTAMNVIRENPANGKMYRVAADGSDWIKMRNYRTGDGQETYQARVNNSPWKFAYIDVVDGEYAMNIDNELNKTVVLNNDDNLIKVNGKDTFVTRDTVVTIFHYDDKTQTVVSTETFTGYNNFPKADRTLYDAYVVAKPNGVVTAIYAVEGVPAPVPEYVYGIYAGKGEDVLGEGQYYGFYVDGALMQYTCDRIYTMRSDIGAVKAYRVELTNGKITDVIACTDSGELFANSGTAAGFIKNENDYITIDVAGNETSYYINNDTVIVEEARDCAIITQADLIPGSDNIFVWYVEGEGPDAGKNIAKYIFVYDPRP